MNSKQFFTIVVGFVAFVSPLSANSNQDDTPDISAFNRRARDTGIQTQTNRNGKAAETNQFADRGRRGRQPVRGSNATSTFEIGPDRQRIIQMNSTDFRTVTEARVLDRGRPTRNVDARISRTRQGMTIHVVASSTARATDYVIQARVNNRWQQLPLKARVTELQTDLSAYRHREVITLPDGTKVVIGDETAGNNDTDFVPTPIVNNWSPEKFGEVGGTLTIEGTNFRDDLVVKIGDVTLEITDQTETQLTVVLPADSDDVPPGALKVLSASGSLIRSCEPHYFVRGDRPFHHMIDSSSHKKINSYLLARLSRWVYNDYHGVTTWTSFRNDFTEKVQPLGITNVDYLRSNSSSTGDTELAILSNPAAIIVVFRGSESPIHESGGFDDWFHTNADFDKKMVNSWQPGAWVHEGFYHAYADVHSQLVDKLTELRNNGQPIFLTGHSLGGALATMAAFRLKQSNFPIQGVYNYGSPRVGNSLWAKAYEDAGLHDLTQRWVNRRDFGPRVPPFAEWQHVGRTNNIHMDGSVDLNDTEVALVFPNGGDHSMDAYCTEMLQELTDDQKDQVQGAE